MPDAENQVCNGLPHMRTRIAPATTGLLSGTILLVDSIGDVDTVPCTVPTEPSIIA